MFAKICLDIADYLRLDSKRLCKCLRLKTISDSIDWVGSYCKARDGFLILDKRSMNVLFLLWSLDKWNLSLIISIDFFYKWHFNCIIRAFSKVLLLLSIVFQTNYSTYISNFIERVITVRQSFNSWANSSKIVWHSDFFLYSLYFS